MNVTQAKGANAPDPLAALADNIERSDAEQVADNPAQAAQQAEGKAQFDKMMAGISVFVFKTSMAVRQRMARKLPELLENWTVNDIAGFADAVPPVVQKRMARLGPLMAEYPEEAMLMLACVPLAMGYVSAVSAHDEKVAAKIGQGGNPSIAAAPAAQAQSTNVAQFVQTTPTP